MEAPVCALVDAMFRLPAKLDALLLRHGHMLPRGAADEISLIKQDLENMVAILQEHEGSGAQDRAMMVKCLTKEVRELSYDMEDSVDQYEHAAGTNRWILSPRRWKYKITRRMGKTAWRLPEKLKWRLWMANKIREFSVRSQEALQRYSLLNNNPGGNDISTGTASTSTRCDPSFGSWHPTPYGEPVGIDAPMKKLEAWLDKNGEQKLKVVSIVGCGGVGKTTLTSELYRRIGGQFECRAFVRTSRKPDVRRLLISMLSQIRPHQTPHTWKVHSLIAEIRTHLQDKRYLIVIDDIWDMQTWDIINRALPDGNLRSGILITTEVEDVALKCCGYDSKYVFTMKPLCHDDSSKLFFNTAFGPKYECPSELSEVANSIIRKCAGLPLATVIVANLLVRQTGKPEQWDYVNNSLGYGLRTNLNSEGMKQVLNLSYNSLPEHLKACVMYLSIYEEDYIIQKEDMVKQWIGEGFIRATEEKDKEEISTSYFDELISSRMIQPVHVNDNDDVLSFSVHYMVLDFVTQKSTEENFVTAIDHCQTTARLADKVRRLSLHFGNAEATSPTNMGLSQVRTLAFFGVFKCFPCIMKFGLLQVLILHLWGDDESIKFDLTSICELFRLKYFHVTSNVTLEVQTNQMRGLQYLETLKIDARVSAVPLDIVHLPGLLHLSLPVKTNLPNSIGHMTSLRSLGYFDISVNSTENMQSLGELTNLRDLRLTCSTMPSCYQKSKMDNMGSVIAKLSNLRSLTLEPSSILDVESSSMSISCDWLSIVSSPPAFLRRFEWLPRNCTFSSLPKWIGYLDKLCLLKIGVSKLVSNDVDVLRGLPALTVLSLFVRTKPAKRIVFNKTGFSVLKYFKFTCSVPWVEFETDAMPNLRKLKLVFDAHGADQHHGQLGMLPQMAGGAGSLIGQSGSGGLLQTPAHQGMTPPMTSTQGPAGSIRSMLSSTVAAPSPVSLQMEHFMAPDFGLPQDMAPDFIRSTAAAPSSVSLQMEHFMAPDFGLPQDMASDFIHGTGGSSNIHGADQDRFETDAMLNVWKLKLGSDALGADQHSTMPVGIEHLSGLKEISAKIGGVGADDPDRTAAESALSYAIKKHPACPTFNIQHVDWMFTGTDDYNSGLQVEEHITLPKQYEIMGEDSNKQHQVLQKESREGANKNVHVRFSSLSESNTGADKQAVIRFSAFSEWKAVAAKQADNRAHPQCSTEDTSGLSPSMRWTTWLKIEALKYDIMKEDSNEQRGFLQKDYMEANKHAHDRKSSSQNVEVDGFIWSKYNQKDILGSKYSRSYYRCMHAYEQGCQAIKRVQWTNEDTQLFDVMYFGNHTCRQAANSQPQTRHNQSSVCVGVKAKGSNQGLQHMPPRSMNLVPQPDSPHLDGSGGAASSEVPLPLSRYESQKRRDWNTFGQYLRNHRPPLSLALCSGAHVLEFLRYLDQFGKTKVHSMGCPFFGHPSPPAPCPCPLRQAWGSLDALVNRLRTAYEENGGPPENNPFGARAVRLYLREVREHQARARGVCYDKKRKKPPPHPAASDVHSHDSNDDRGPLDLRLGPP